MKKDCSSCNHLGRDCPKKLILLSLDELIDWCQFIMTKYKITHELLARLSNTPKGTIDRIISKQSTDCRYSTIHAIVCALLEYLGIPLVCLDEVEAQTEALTSDMARQNAELQIALADSEKERQALQARVDEFAERRAFMKEQIAKKDARIDALAGTVAEWRRVVKVLATSLGMALLVIIASLVIDKLSPDLGFFWRT